MVFAVEMSSEENIVTVSEVADLLHQQYAIITGKPNLIKRFKYLITIIYHLFTYPNILVHVECFPLEVG